MNKKVGVIIVSYNSRLYIDDLFFSLAKVNYLNWQIIFLDNNSTDNSADHLKEKFGAQFSNLTIMKLDKNSGFAIGNNIGLKYLQDNGFDYAYLLNQDTVVESDFLERALEAMKEGVGSAQSLIRLYNNENKTNSLGNAIHFLGFGYCYGYGWSKEATAKFLEKWRARDKELNIAYGSGAGMLLNMRVLEEVGFFDEDYFMYHEDLDLGWRLRLEGYKNVLAPESIIYHKYEFSKSIKKYYWMERNRFITIFKNYSAWSLFLIMPALIIMEAGLLFFSIFSGFWREKIKVYEYFLYPKNWRKICAKRNKIQKLRSSSCYPQSANRQSDNSVSYTPLCHSRESGDPVSDREIFQYFVGKILFQDIDNWILRKIANPIFNLYWRIISSIL